jgi:serine dehydrogenase proteinase
MTRERAADVARALSEGRWTHDFPIDVALASALGLPVETDLPDEVRRLMRLYPQPRAATPEGSAGVLLMLSWVTNRRLGTPLVATNRSSSRATTIPSGPNRIRLWPSERRASGHPG